MPRKPFRGLISCAAVVLFLFPSISALTQAQETGDPPFLSIDGIIDKVTDNYAKVENFQCALDKFERLDDKTDYRTYRYFFMKPRLIRMEIIKGKNRGAVAVFKDGKVKARKGGLLKPFRMTYEPEDETVTSLRGRTILESDWQNIIDKLRTYYKEKKLKLIGMESRNGRQVYLIETKDQEEGVLTKRKLWIDAATYLPFMTEMYEDEVLVSSMTYSDILVNTDMPREIFN